MIDNDIVELREPNRGKTEHEALAEIERLRAALSRIAQYQHAGSGMGQLAEIAQEALDGH